ncbi:hypothetical protein ACHAW6_013091 [Cyclotella cf. meneghiniana]
MSRQDRQADLRRRMAEARSKLHISASSDDNERVDSKIPLPPSAAGGILRKSKYTSKNLDDQAATAKGAVSNGNKSESNALGGLMGGYSSSEDEEQGGVVSKSDVGVSAGKKKRASVTVSSNDVTRADANAKRAKFHSESPLKDSSLQGKTGLSQSRKADGYNLTSDMAIDEKNLQKFEQKSDKADMANQVSEETISEDVWNEFNALIDDDYDSNVPAVDGGNIDKDTSVRTPIRSEQSTPSDTIASADATIKTKKKKKKSEERKENTYDNETISNVEQVSYEARLARLMLLKSRMHGQKTDVDNNDNTLGSLDFYNPSLAFQEDEDDVDEPDISQDNKSEEEALSENSLENLSAPPARIMQSTSSTPLASSMTLSRGSHLPLVTILKKRRNQVRHMSACGEDVDVSMKESEDSFTDGRWF